MCKNSQKKVQNCRLRECPNGRRTLPCTMACGPNSRARLRTGQWYDSGTGQSRAGLGSWPIAFDWGPSQMLLCSRVQFSGPTSRPAFGRVNASVLYRCQSIHRHEGWQVGDLISAHGWALQKWLNWLICRLGADVCGSKEPCISWGKGWTILCCKG